MKIKKFKKILSVFVVRVCSIVTRSFWLRRVQKNPPGFENSKRDESLRSGTENPRYNAHHLSKLDYEVDWVNFTVWLPGHWWMHPAMTGEKYRQKSHPDGNRTADQGRVGGSVTYPPPSDTIVGRH